MDGSAAGNEFPAKLDDLLLGILDGLVRCDTVLYWRDQQGTHDPPTAGGLQGRLPRSLSLEITALRSSLNTALILRALSQRAGTIPRQL